MAFRVVPYDAQWPGMFSAESGSLQDALAPWLDGGVRHIGSTSVPGLAAKPIIDMMAGVRDLAAAQGAAAVLADLGYGHAPHRPDALWFFKPDIPRRDECTHALHLTEAGSPLWCERLAFRDALRADDGLRDEYAALKLELAAVYGDDMPGYTARKRDFVARVLGGAGISLRPR